MPFRLAVAFLCGGVVFAAEIPKGAHVLLRMVNSINTRTAREGDYVYMQTATPVAADDEIVLPPNSYVQGVVTRAKHSGLVTGRAELGIRLETVTLPGGRVFKFSPRLSAVDSGDNGQQVDERESAIKQSGSKGQDVERIAIT